MARARKKTAPKRRERRRDYAAEYRQRIARAEKLARATGTRFYLSAARGHPRGEASVSELRRLEAEILEGIRKQKRQTAFQRLCDVLSRAGKEPNLPTLRVGVSVMTDRQLDETARITITELRQRARRSPKIYDAMGIEWNPYWYH